MHKTALESAEERAQTEAMKRTDESFRQFFWNNFIQEEGVVFYEHSNVRTGQASIKSSDELQADSVRIACRRDKCPWLPFMTVSCPTFADIKCFAC